MENQETKQHKAPFISMNEACIYLGLSKATLYGYTHKKVNTILQSTEQKDLLQG